MARTFAAVDLGASAGRVMAGVVEGDRVELHAVHRFPNGVAEVDGHLRWNLTELFEEVRIGLSKLPEAESIGIDTWAVDYGLLDGDGNLLAEPVAYRDDRTAKVIDEVHELVSPEELFGINGLQFLPFNTIYQLAAENREGLLDRATQAVLLPDLIAYWLTGQLRSELTNASTTGLLDVRHLEWSTWLLERVGIDRTLLPPIEAPGEVRGVTSDGTPVTTVGSHDTASAVVGVPAITDDFAYIASGTWSLVGLELPSPVLTERARTANFTNEIGVGGRTRFLRNVGGLWLLQECMRAWARDDLDQLVAAAGQLPSGGPTIDVDDPMFIPPGGMPERITQAAGGISMSPEQLTRCVLDSLAAAYARTIDEAASLAGRRVDVIHVVGGGSQNELLCQLTADVSGRPVLAGPVEATALGNLLVQAAARGAMPSSLEAMRERVAASMSPRRYDPS